MNKIFLIMCVGVLAFSGSAFGAWDDPAAPLPFFVSRQAAALSVPFDSDPNGTQMEAVGFGHKQFQQGTWQFLNGAAWTHDQGMVRYWTTLKNGAPTTTSVRTDIDWVLVIDYAHTGFQYGANDNAWYVKSEPDDIRIITLRYVGGGGFTDLWELAAGNGSGGWDVIPNGGGLVLGEEFHHYVIHYKAFNQRLDIYMDDVLLAGDYELGHGRYDLNFVQLQGILNDPTDLVRDKYREVKVYNGVREDTGFGYKWLQEHPYEITGVRLLNDNWVDDDLFTGTNISTVLAFKVQPEIIDQAVRLGHTWHLKAGSTRWTQPEDAATNQAKSVIQLLYNDPARPGGTAFMAYDEPELTTIDPNEMLDAANKTSWFVAGLHPELITYTNAMVMSLNPGDASRVADYTDYLNDIVQIVKPDVLHCDTYPFELTPGGSPPHDPEEILENSYFLHLKTVRGVALAAGLPYWVFIQSFEGGGRVFPSESDLRMQIFSSLTFGFTGISYFTYDPIFFPNRSLVDPDYAPNSLYFAAQSVNPEVINVGQAIRLLKSTDVSYVVGQHLDGVAVDNNLPQGTVAWTSGDDPYITDITATNTGSTNDGLAGDVFVGYFTLLPVPEKLDGPGFVGEIYFMVTNLLRGSSNAAAETQQSIRLDFDFGASGITSLQRLSRATGEVEEVSLVSDGGSTYHLDVVLDGGTGDLFKFNSGARFIYQVCDFILEGDMNQDCVVDEDDQDLFFDNWLTCTAPECD